MAPAALKFHGVCPCELVPIVVFNWLAPHLVSSLLITCIRWPLADCNYER